jgi:plastocyanin
MKRQSSFSESLSMSQRRTLIWVAMLWTGAAGLRSQAMSQVTTTALRGRVEIIGEKTAGKNRHNTMPTTVVWLTPMPGTAGEANAGTPDPPKTYPAGPAQSARLVQKNKSFDPHILVVQAGSLVEFPNHDPFFHNVFSLFEGKRFDLGLYEAGTSRMVRFDRAGISYIFCNIHPDMSAVVITLATSLYAISSRDGQLSLAGVPYGRYMLHVWSEGMGPENTEPLMREITIAENASSLGVIRVPEANGQSMVHKNKYGREYDEPTPNNSVYKQQR